MHNLYHPRYQREGTGARYGQIGHIAMTGSGQRSYVVDRNTHVALLVAGLALNPQGRAIGLDMADASTRKALLMSEGAGQRASRRFMA